MDKQLVAEHPGGWKAYITQDEDPESPDAWDDAPPDATVYLTTTRNRYFEKNPDYLEDAEERSACWSFPLYAYIHGGVSLGIGRGSVMDCPWDSGQIGEVRVRKEAFASEQQAREAAQAEVCTWNQYLSWDIWGVIIEQDGEHRDSCWGFYGEDNASAEARTMLASAVDLELGNTLKIDAVWAW